MSIERIKHGVCISREENSDLGQTTASALSKTTCHAQVWNAQDACCFQSLYSDAVAVLYEIDRTGKPMSV